MKCPVCNGSGEVEFCDDKQVVVNNVTIYVDEIDKNEYIEDITARVIKRYGRAASLALRHIPKQAYLN